MDDVVLYEVSDGIAKITLNRPDQMNAWTGELGDELQARLGEADCDDEVVVVVITGAGKAFCAGADLGDGESGFLPVSADDDGRPRLWPYQVRKPVIAAVNGHAVGVGITFSMLCDVRLVAEDAKVQYAMVRRGVVPELASHVILPRVIGFSKAAELMLTGRMLSGAEAAELGLASRAVPADQVLTEAMSLGADMVRNASPVALAVSKQLLWQGVTAGVDEMLSREGRVISSIARMPDAVEGVTAFFERRDAVWSGSVNESADDLLEC
ncbi:MAG: crotonase [Acidimicrobiaceae bacterium]|nr:crotonase [Acidimicrobiaceae bacterium]HBU75916.1 crotonase [Acidimicrobiaceae bacterium]